MKNIEKLNNFDLFIIFGGILVCLC